ncbi:MAG: hypothetical protein EXQ74_03750 [Thermoleophilia bacterium]|nr:hypothetical protein [Thermoleophilia bacterium]
MKNPRYEAKVEATAAGVPSTGRTDGLPKGAPTRAGMKSVLVRAGVAAAIFFVFLYFVNKDTPQMSLTFAVIMGVIMIPLGIFLDRLAHRMAVRRWKRRNGVG